MTNPASAVAATAMEAADIMLQNTAHNLANARTTAFHTDKVIGTNLVYEDVTTGGGPVGQTDLGIPQVQVGAGVRIASSLKTMRNGVPEPTKNQLDIHIDGTGYLQIDLGNGMLGYTRAGHLKVDEYGILRTATDYPLMDNITVDLNKYSEVIIDKSGRVFGVDPSQYGTARHTQLGQLTLWSFANPQGLENKEDTIFIETPEAGASTQGIPGLNNLGKILQGYAERSTVDTSMTLVEAINIQQYSNAGATLLKLAEDMDKHNLQQISSVG